MSSLSLLGSSPLSLVNTALPSPVDLSWAFCSHSHGFCAQNRQEAGMWDACWKRDRSSICFVVNDRHSQAPSLISELLDAEGPGLPHRVCASRLPHGGRNKVLRGSGQSCLAHWSLRVTSLLSHCVTEGTVRSPESSHQEFCWGKASLCSVHASK